MSHGPQMDETFNLLKAQFPHLYGGGVKDTCGTGQFLNMQVTKSHEVHVNQ